MFRILAGAVAAALLFAASAGRAETPSDEPIRVMIVGVFHFDNPGLDLNNMAVDPMTTPARQAELAAIAQRLAQFRPTAIALERVADNEDLRDQGFARHTPGDYSASNDERLQLGYRLADLMGIERVFAIDEQADEGQADYFPLDRLMDWIDAEGEQARLGGMMAPVQAYMAELEARQRTESIGALLAETNRPDHPINIGGHGGGYYQLMRFGRGETQPGAELNGRWYTRNAYIFARLMQVARPGDRVVVIFGAGHNYWLRHFVETTPGFELVEAGDYLAD